MIDVDHRPRLGVIGRCKSGLRWFWYSHFNVGVNRGENLGESEAHGWSVTGEQALSEANAALMRIANGRPINLHVYHESASHTLKEINKAKRDARPCNGSKSNAPVEYLYDYYGDKFRITKKTIARIYIVKQEENHLPEEEGSGFIDHRDLQTGFVDRRKVFQKRPLEEFGYGEVAVQIGSRRYSYLSCFYLGPWEQRPWEDRARNTHFDLRKLKAEMAASHPDKGGSYDAFREARQRYVDARCRMEAAAV